MFLHPLMLFGMLGVSVPIIIHLLNKHNIRQTQWAAMRFLQKSVESNQRRLQLEDLLLLLLRCLIIALIALALARPALHSATGFFGGGGVNVVIVLDNSMSMGTTAQSTSRFSDAQAAAEQIIDSLPGGSAAALFLASDVVDEIIPEPSSDLNYVRQCVRDAKLTDRSTELHGAIVRAVDMLRRKTAGGEIYLITDGQQNGFAAFANIRSTIAEVKDSIHTRLILVGSPGPTNLAVTDVHFAGALPIVGKPMRMEASVSNFSAQPANRIRVRLQADADPPGDETTIDSLAPGESKTVGLVANVRDAGPHAISVQIDPDNLPADNHRETIVRVTDALNVLIISRDGLGNSREADSFYLRQALQPVPFSERETYAIRVSEIGVSESGKVRWNQFDVAILVNLPDLAPSTADAMTDFVNRGGGLMVFPGDTLDVGFYNNELLQKRNLLPAQIMDAAGDAAQEEQFIALAPPKYEHPVAAFWNDPGSGNPTSARFYRRFQFKPLKDARSIFSFSDHSPAVIEREVGQGRVVLFASTANTKWNDLPVRPGLFVPLMHRLVGRMVLKQDESLNPRVGEKIVYRAPSTLLGKSVLVAPPTRADEKTSAKQSRTVELQNSVPVVTFEQTDRAGAYVFTADDLPAVKYACQTDPNESRLTSLSPEQIALLEADCDVIRWSAGTTVGATVSGGRAGAELWQPILIAALVIGGLEMLLAQWFSQSK